MHYQSYAWWLRRWCSPARPGSSRKRCCSPCPRRQLTLARPCHPCWLDRMWPLGACWTERSCLVIFSKGKKKKERMKKQEWWEEKMVSLTFLFLTASRFSSSCRSIFFRFCFFSRWRAVSTDSLASFLFLLRWKKQEMVKTRKKKKNQDKNKKKQNGQSTFFAFSLVSSVSISSSVRHCCPRKRCCSPCPRRQLTLARPCHPG